MFDGSRLTKNSLLLAGLLELDHLQTFIIVQATGMKRNLRSGLCVICHSFMTESSMLDIGRKKFNDNICTKFIFLMIFLLFEKSFFK